MQYSSQAASPSVSSRFFAFVQQTLWYRRLLHAVVAALADLSPGSRVLDVGTGPGGLLALLHQELAFDCVGVDADQAMLNEARRHPGLAEALLVHVPVGHALPFAPQTFDAICFCSVLYLMDAAATRGLLQQAESLLRPEGRIIILTPSGAGHLHWADARHHWTFYLWRRLTSASGRQWQAQGLAREFAEQQGMRYVICPTFSDMATVEVITAP